MSGVSEAQYRLLKWMADGDRALHKSSYNELAYGQLLSRARFKRLASRKTVEILVKLGLIAWGPDCPSDLRVMLTRAGYDFLGLKAPKDVPA